MNKLVTVVIIFFILEAFTSTAFQIANLLARNAIKLKSSGQEMDIGEFENTEFKKISPVTPTTNIFKFGVKRFDTNKTKIRRLLRRSIVSSFFF